MMVRIKFSFYDKPTQILTLKLKLFDCKGVHHATICTKRHEPNTLCNTAETNYIQSNATILLQTADVLLNGRQEVKVNVHFDSGSQSSYVSKGIHNFLKLKPISTENMTFNTFGNTQSKADEVDRVELSAKTRSGYYFLFEALR